MTIVASLFAKADGVCTRMLGLFSCLLFATLLRLINRCVPLEVRFGRQLLGPEDALTTLLK